MNHRLTEGAMAENFDLTMPDGNKATLERVAEDRPLLLFFLRYAGCPICQMTLQNLAADHAVFEKAGMGVIAVLQTTPDSLTATAVVGSLPFPVRSDPEGDLFARYGVGTVPLWRYLTPSVIRKAMLAKKSGFSHGPRTGRELQTPAVFLIDRQLVIRYAYYGKNIGDLPATSELLAKRIA